MTIIPWLREPWKKTMPCACNAALNANAIHAILGAAIYATCRPWVGVYPLGRPYIWGVVVVVVRPGGLGGGAEALELIKL